MKLNFYCLVIVVFFFFVHTVLFSLSFLNIRAVRKACTSEKNFDELRFAQQVSGSMVICSSLFMLCQFTYVIVQGSYN